MDRDELAMEVRDRCALEGTFVLRSGAVSDHYFDKYQFEAEPSVLKAIVEHLVPLIPDDTEVLAGLELGGVPVATALSLATGLPAAFVRKEAKTYGTARLAEGTDVGGRRCLIVEDIVSSGGQIVVSAHGLRQRGATVTQALCVIDRSGGDHHLLTEGGLELIALFESAELLNA